MPIPQPSRLVLDALAAVRIIEGSPEALELQETLLAADLVIALELRLTEVANALWRLQRAGQLELDRSQGLLTRTTALVDYIEPDRTLQGEALALARHLDHPLDDCLYLVLAGKVLP